MSKEEMRQAALQSRQATPAMEVDAMSRLVEGNLEALEEFAHARRLATYVAKPGEVQTVRIIERALSEGRTVAVPLVDDRGGELEFYVISSLAELTPGHFGIMEPAGRGTSLRLADTDVVLVPLLAWDGRGERLGYGRGYFDRALAGRGSSVAVGLAFESQYVGHVPDQPTDVPLDLVVTETRVVRFGESR